MLIKKTDHNLRILENSNIFYKISSNLEVIFVKNMINGLSDIIEHDEKFFLVSNKFESKKNIYFSNGEILNLDEFLIIAGPCSIKDEKSLLNVAKKIKDSGFKYFRAGAYKPRTSPHDFQGFERDGLELLKLVKKKFNLKIVSEIMDASDIEIFADVVDIFQVGARNMQNFTLLKKLGQIKNPILLKRGLSSTMEEFVLAAEYIVSYGNNNVILCERGIRTFENKTRNTLDLSVVCFVKQNTNLPIIVDPSHGCGIRSYIKDLSLAALCCGSDGLIIESDIDPLLTATDIEQTISIETLNDIRDSIINIAPLVGKKYGKN